VGSWDVAFWQANQWSLGGTASGGSPQPYDVRVDFAGVANNKARIYWVALRVKFRPPRNLVTPAVVTVGHPFLSSALQSLLNPNAEVSPYPRWNNQLERAMGLSFSGARFNYTGSFYANVKGYAEGTIFRVYQHIFAGTILLHTGKSPYDHDQLPFVFCVYDRDEHGDPYSMVEGLKDLQKEVNFRRSKMLAELNNPQLLVDPSILATMGLDVDSVQDHASKPGAVWVGSPGGVQWLTRMDIASQQFNLMQDSKSEIQATSGANDDLMGYNSSSRSGKAKELVMGQGQMQMRPAEANYRSAFKRLGEITLQLIQQYHQDEWLVRVTDDIGQDSWVEINKVEFDPQTGSSRKINDITSARMQVEVDVMPWTPTLRARSTEFLMSMAHNETDPYVRRSLERAAIMVSDMPDKAKILKIFDEQAQQQAQQAEQQGQMQQAQMQAEQQREQLDSAMKAQKTQAEVKKMEHDMQMDELEAQMKLALPVLPTDGGTPFG
jgi:hypothetical protein